MAPARREREIEKIESALLAEKTRIVVKRRRFVERVSKMRKITDLGKLVIQATRDTVGDERDAIENHPVLHEFILTARYCEKLMLANDKAISALAAVPLKQHDRDDALNALRNARRNMIDQAKRFIHVSKAPRHTELDSRFIDALRQHAYPRSTSDRPAVLAARFLLTDRLCEHALVASEDIERQLTQRDTVKRTKKKKPLPLQPLPSALGDDSPEAAFGFVSVA